MESLREAHPGDSNLFFHNAQKMYKVVVNWYMEISSPQLENFFPPKFSATVGIYIFIYIYFYVYILKKLINTCITV